MKYEYVNSELWKNIEYCNDLGQLHCMARYIDGAVDYHQDDKDNYDFFKAAQDHWHTKVSVKVREYVGDQTKLF